MNLKNPTLQILTWFAMGAACCFVLWWLSAVLMPFILAGVIAYLLLPAVLFLSRKKRFSNGLSIQVPRFIAALAVEIAFFLAISLLFFLIGPELANKWPYVRDELPGLIQELTKLLSPYLKTLGLPTQIDKSSLEKLLKQYFDLASEADLLSLLSSVKLGGSIAFTVLGNLVLIPLVLFYLLLEGDSYYEHCMSWLPRPLRPSIESFLHDCNVMLDQYLRGQFSVMVVLAIYYTSALSFFGSEMAFPIGIFTGLVIFVPYLGFGLGLLMAFLSSTLQFGVAQAFFVVGIVYGLGQLIEGFILTPKLVGKRIGLHPLGLIFVLLAFGQLLGFVGVLVALPVSTILLVAVRRVKEKYLHSDVYTG